MKNLFIKKLKITNFIYPEHVTNLFYNIKCPNLNDHSQFLIPFSIQDIILKNINNLEFKKI